MKSNQQNEVKHMEFKYLLVLQDFPSKGTPHVTRWNSLDDIEEVIYALKHLDGTPCFIFDLATCPMQLVKVITL